MSDLAPGDLASVELSYDAGNSLVKLLGSTIGAHFERVVSDNPNRQAIVGRLPFQELTYSQLKDRVEQLARGMLALGITRGERIGIWSTNNVEWLITKLAAASIGAIFVNINPAYKSAELEYILKQSGTRLLIVIPENRGVNYLGILENLAPELFSPDIESQEKTSQLEHIAVIGAQANISPHIISFDNMCRLGDTISLSRLVEERLLLDMDDPINIQYTSGTTGAPKGVTLSHHNLLNNAWLAAKAMGLTCESRFCIPMPFYHCGGMVSSALATLAVGGTIVIPSAYFAEEQVLQAVQAERCTHLSGVPTMFMAQLENPDFSKFDLSSLSGGFMAGAPCPVQLMRRVASDMHMREIIILYGLTEASPLVTCTTVQDSLETRTTTVGRVIPGLELKIVEPQTGRLLPRGSQGELCTRGHGVMIGYWNNDSATREAIDQAGWLHSGDLAVMNEDGLINITGRKKEIIIRGGENIYPREIEELLLDYEAIAQVNVFGVPDACMGEEVAVWLKLKHGRSLEESHLIAWLRERIALFKVPKYIRVVEEFPMTVTGKVQKYAMRQSMIQELGLEEIAAIQTA